MKSSKLLRWEIISLQGVIAVALLHLAEHQQTAKTAQNSGFPVWDYLPPSATILHCLDYPAAVLAGLLTSHNTLLIGGEHYRAWSVLYVFCVLLLWYWVLFRGLHRNGIRRIEGIAGVLITGFLLLRTVLLLGGSYPAMLVLFAFVWTAFLAFLSLRATSKAKRHFKLSSA